MERLANLIWDPFLCLFYLALGVLFASMLGGVAFRRLGDAVRVLGLRGTEDARSISHRDGFLAALGATVGVGNLAGVATALHLGGPGALFWMWISAIVGMHFRFASTYLAIEHQRQVAEDEGFATPMVYLDRFLPARFRFISVAFAGLLVVVGFVNANLVQSNSVAHALTSLFDVPTALVAVLLAGVVGAVIIAGLGRIVHFSVRITPWMILAYVLAACLALASEPAAALGCLRAVFSSAFRPHSVWGGVSGAAVFGALRFGVSRGIFSHGCGMATAPFFQARNRDHPLRGALVAAAVPVFDTLIVCTLTGLVILVYGDWFVTTGAFLTVSSFATAMGSLGRTVVLASLAVFAFTTTIAWAHFAERCFQYLGGRSLLGFRVAFAFVTLLGPFFPVSLVWSLGDVLVAAVLVLHLLPLTFAVARAPLEITSELDPAVLERE